MRRTSLISVAALRRPRWLRQPPRRRPGLRRPGGGGGGGRCGAEGAAGLRSPRGQVARRAPVCRTAPAPVSGPRLRLERPAARALGWRRPWALAPRGAGDRARPSSGPGRRPDRRRDAGPGVRPVLPAAAVVGRAGRSSGGRGPPARARARPLAGGHARAACPPAAPRDRTVSPAAARGGSRAAPRGPTRASRASDPDRRHRTDAADRGTGCRPTRRSYGGHACASCSARWPCAPS